MRIFNSEKITKKQAAKLVHEYLRNVLKEKDVEDISGAQRLKDLYDCHTCVAHVTQVFLKGIIFPKSDREFGMNDVLHVNELEEIEGRVFDEGKRILPHVQMSKQTKIPTSNIPSIRGALIIDIRTPAEYEESHYPGAVNIPFHRINLNPHIVSDDKIRPIVFICNEGVNSLLAAEIAEAAGYMEVYYSAYKSY